MQSNNTRTVQRKSDQTTAQQKYSGTVPQMHSNYTKHNKPPQARPISAIASGRVIVSNQFWKTYQYLFSQQQWSASWAIIHFYTYTGQWMTSHISVPGTVSMLLPLLCFILLLFTSILPVSGT